MSTIGWGVLCGLGLGLGLWAMIAALPALRRPRLEARLAPYLVDVSPAARELAWRRRPAAPLLGELFGPAALGARDAVLRWIGGEASVALRLRQAGSARSVEGFRLLQLGGVLAGGAAGLLCAAGIAAARPVPVLAWVALSASFAVAGFVACDALLTRAAARRLSRIAEEFPTVAELLALSLAAGEGVHDAIRRVARASSGELGAELRTVVADVGVGVPLADALERMARQLRLPALVGFVDAVTGALERGAPLAEVLRAQASDARAERKRDLLELAGRKEVAMLLPLIFGELPLTVLIAVFPGVFILRTGM
ncbi:type II secretion system F family protein [Gryllotalpicola ginsengisoli]|uniref:type II secretion system F family protein n=1 Tax=Gryllotalpicola ginsengisoli TaxID=444608 RepID=UPI0003B6BB58|nr:type II secretion system F family protein [Gryllotalpicola ginsengisoli]